MNEDRDASNTKEYEEMTLAEAQQWYARYRVAFTVKKGKIIKMSYEMPYAVSPLR